VLAFLAIAVSANPAASQLSAPNASGVSLGHLHFMVGDPEEHKKIWVGVLGAKWCTRERWKCRRHRIRH
jgi:hypothetical protein